MPEKKSNNIKLGIFVTIVIIIFTFGVYNIGNKQNLFGSTLSISTIVNDASGLQSGNNVRYAGINVGIVDEIIFLNDSTLKVTMSLQEEVQKFIKKDAVSSIGSDGLVGNMIVNIDPGKGNASMIEEGDVLNSIAKTETKEILNALDRSSENIAALTLNLLQITEKINEGSGSLSLLLNDKNLSNDINQSIINFRQSTKAIADMSMEIKNSIASVAEGKGILGYLLKDTTFKNDINGITQSLDQLINERTATIVDNLEQSSQAISQTTESLKSKVDKLAFDQGVAGLVLNDSIVAQDLRKAIQNLEKGTDGFNQNMEALKHNFLFKKYFKKIEKQKRRDGTALK